MIMNGRIDSLVQYPGYITMAYNNTYGIQAVDESVAHKMTDAFERPGGYREKVLECRVAAATFDSHGLGSNKTINAPCSEANYWCYSRISRSGERRGVYDIAGVAFTSTISSLLFTEGFLNQEHVQKAMGVPIELY